MVQLRLEQTADELWHLESVTLAQVECSASLFDKFQAAMQEMWDKFQLKDRQLAAPMNCRRLGSLMRPIVVWKS